MRILFCAFLLLACVAGVSLVTTSSLDAATFLRGDSNADGVLDLSDAQFTLSYLFLGGAAPPCRSAADTNDDETIDITDAIFALGFLFLGEDPPPPPWPDAGVDPTAGLGCGAVGPPNEAPRLLVETPADGTVVDGDTLPLRVRVDDDSAVLRVLVGGIDVTPAGPPPVPFSVSVDVPLEPGPSIVRLGAVDDVGRATFRELAVARTPLLRSGSASEGVILAVTGDTGFDELEAIVAPFLDDLPGVLDAGIRGEELYRGSVLGVDTRVRGNRVEVSGAIELDFFPTAEAGGRTGMSVRFAEVRLFADGESDYGILGTDSWDARWTANDVSIRGTFDLTPDPSGSGLTVASDGFIASIGGSSLSVSGFLDPLGIFDGLVNFLAGFFEDEIEAQVRTAVEDAADEQVLPVLADALGRLDLDLDLGDLTLATTFAEVDESLAGLVLRFDALWEARARDPSYPAHAGSPARFAPPPAFPPSSLPAHPVDAVISLSADTLNQAFGELLALGALSAAVDLHDTKSPIPLEVGTLATVLDPRLLELPGVSADSPLGLRVAARAPLDFRPGLGTPGRSILGVGEDWRLLKGTAEPPSTWARREFDDTQWLLLPGGFGYSSEPLELLDVMTVLDDMAAGAYTSLYARRAFSLEGAMNPVLRLTYDDGLIAYLNGEEIYRANLPEPAGTPARFDTTAEAAIEPTTVDIELAPFSHLLTGAENVLAIQGHNAGTASSDFVLVPELYEPAVDPAGTISSLAAQVALQELVITFVADTAGDGVGPDDAGGDRDDDVDLFAYSLSVRLQTALSLVRGPSGEPLVAFTFEGNDGADRDALPDAIVGGARGLGIAVAFESIDMDDARLAEFAELVLALFASSLGEALRDLDLPAFPLPELAFDVDGDGITDVRLDIRDATLTAADTDGDGLSDWICILSDLTAR